MANKSFDRFSYADLFPLVKKFFKQNVKWHPLTGGLPFNFLSQRLDALDMRCAEIILKARGLWGVLSWNKDDPDFSMTQVLFDCIPDILSRSATAAGKILAESGADQIPETHLLEEARQKTGPVDDYKIFSVFSIYFGWNTLKKLLCSEFPMEPDTLRQTLIAERFFNKAFLSWEFLRLDKSKRATLSKKGKVLKTNPGLLAAGEEAWKNCKFKTAQRLWSYLVKNYELHDGCFQCRIAQKDYELSFDKDDPKIMCVVSWAKGDKAFSTNQRIGFNAFKKNYFPKIRKKMET